MKKWIFCFVFISVIAFCIPNSYHAQEITTTESSELVDEELINSDTNVASLAEMIDILYFISAQLSFFTLVIILVYVYKFFRMFF